MSAYPNLDSAVKKIAELEEKLQKKEKINKALMYQIEHMMNAQGDAFSSFQTSAILENKIAERTRELQKTQRNLERINHETLLLNKELISKQRIADAANKAKSEFLSSMSHELRTPLNAILGYSEMLMEDLAGDEAEDAEKIYQAGKHLLNLVNDVLNLSKIEAGKMEIYIERCHLHKFFKEVLETIHPLIEKNDNSLETDCQLTYQVVLIDVMKLRQILFNLFSNADKFTKKGIISLQVKFIQKHKKNYLHLKIQDTGIGISEEQQQNLFQAFNQADKSTTRKYGGTGLGLVLCKHFAEILGGEIKLTSALGAGSRFDVYIPVEI